MHLSGTFAARWRRLRRSPAIWLGGIAALLYSSWPLSYILNPAVGRHELASQLEAPHQPYAWLFILLDVFSGVLIAVVALLQLRMRRYSRLALGAVIFYVLFGVLVAGAAV